VVLEDHLGDPKAWSLPSEGRVSGRERGAICRWAN